MLPLIWLNLITQWQTPAYHLCLNKRKLLHYVCFGFYVLFENFPLIWKCYHYRWMAVIFFPMLGIHDHWIVRILQRGTPIVISGIHLLLPYPRTRDIHICYWAFISGAVTILFYDLHVGLSRLGFEHPIFRMRGDRSSQIRHRSGATSCINFLISRCY